MRIAFLLLTLSLATIGCRKSITYSTSAAVTTPDTLVKGTIIRSAGTWSAHSPKGSQTLEVTVSGTSISWEITSEEKHPGGGSSSGTGSSGMTLSAPSDPWFIYVETPQRLWFFDGKDALSYSLSDNGGSRSGPAIFVGKLQPTNEKIPRDLIPHLPAEMQKLFPPVEPKETRRSF